MAAFKAQVFGHSFVRRLKTFIHDNDDLHFNMNLRDPALIQYSGFSGATVNGLRQQLQVVADFEPDMLVLIAGTNDLSHRELSPASVCQAICDLVDTLLFVQGVKKVIVFQIFHRLVPSIPTRHRTDVPWFNDRVDATNELLRDSLPRIHPSRAKYWHCKGFWSPDVQHVSFSGDGVHLSAQGQRKLYFNLRAAVVNSLKETQ